MEGHAEFLAWLGSNIKEEASQEAATAVDKTVLEAKPADTTSVLETDTTVKEHEGMAEARNSGTTFLDLRPLSDHMEANDGSGRVSGQPCQVQSFQGGSQNNVCPMNVKDNATGKLMSEICRQPGDKGKWYFFAPPDGPTGPTGRLCPRITAVMKDGPPQQGIACPCCCPP